MRRLLTASLTAALLVTGASVGSAHSDLVSSNPKDGARLDTMPSSVTLTFNEDIDPQFAQVVVADASDVVRTTTPTVEGPTVTVPMPAGEPAGEVEVRYRVVSADGHPVSGDISFTAGTPPTATPTATAGGRSPSAGTPAPAPADSATAAEEPSTTWAYILTGLAVALVLGVGLVIAALARRRR